MYRVGDLRGSRGADLCAAASAAIRGGPSRVLPAFLVMLLIASGASVLILTVVPADGDQPVLNDWVRGVAAALCLGAIAALLYVRSGRAPAQREPRDSDTGLTTGLLSLGVLLLLLLLPVYLLAARTHPPTEEWIGYGFFDKRWLVTTFLLGTLGAMVVTTAVAQIVRSAAAAPRSWRSWIGAAFAATPTRPALTTSAVNWARVAGGIAGAVVLAAYFFGPPWHVALDEVNVHETPMMAGVQAIANGATPYIDSAAVQYGPGSELFQYLYLQTSGFDLASLREAGALLFMLGAAIFFAIVLIRLPLKLAVASCLVSVLVFPTLQMISFGSDGTIQGALGRLVDEESIGVWGWANPMRYLGVFAIAMLLPVVATLPGRRQILWAGVALGSLWGFTCYVSQENLIGGVIAGGTLALLLALSQTIPRRRVAQALVGIGLGFAAIAAVVFGYYAANGELSRFLKLYFLIPPAVSAGYSNTVFFDGWDGPWGRAYFLLPFLLGALCVLSMIRLHPLRVARGWSPRRVLLVSALVAACVAHPGSLLRSDASHLINTMLALPVALVLAVTYLPGLLGVRSSDRRRLMAVALVVIPLALLPLTQLRNTGNRLSWPLARFSHESKALEWQRADPDSVAAARLTPDILARPAQWCCSYYNYPVTMRELAAILNQVNRVVGDRRVYVANFIEDLHPGGAYFLADLRPARILFEPTTMAMNERLLDDFISFYRDHIDGVEAVVAVYPRLPEVEIFKRTYPDYRRKLIPYSYGTITVLTR